MSAYLAIKWVHILSSVLLAGTGFGSAFYLFFANRSANVAAQAVVTRLVVRADWWFTAPAGVVQAATGLTLATMAGFPLKTPWVACSIGLFVFAGACWVPVIWLQIRMETLARHAAAVGAELPARYWRFARIWELLGYPAFAAMLIVYWLMVTKPSFSGTRWAS